MWLILITLVLKCHLQSLNVISTNHTSRVHQRFFSWVRIAHLFSFLYFVLFIRVCSVSGSFVSLHFIMEYIMKSKDNIVKNYSIEFEVQFKDCFGLYF